MKVKVKMKMNKGENENEGEKKDRPPMDFHRPIDSHGFFFIDP